MKALAILLAVACGTLAAPRFSLRRPTCEDSQSRFVPSKKYVYRYVGISSTGIKGTTDEKAAIKIEARFHVTSVSSCVFHLEVDEVKLSERSSPDIPFTPSKGNKEFKRDLEGSPLTFTSVHGQILDIKKSKQEPVYVTNIKKGMLSALQLEFKEEGESIVNERDIAGDCKTRYLRLINNGKEDVYKLKNLTECTNRSDMDTLMHPVIYTSSSSKRTPVECTSVCHYKVAKKQINSVECKETHLLRPLSSNSAGVMTTVTQKIVLEKTSSFSGYSQNLQDDSSEISDLRFDFNMKKKLQESLQDDTSSVDKILRDMVEKTPSSKETLWVAPLAYTKLVFELRRLDFQGLNTIWNKFYECQNDYWDADFCRTKEEEVKYEELIVDALSQCGTEACVKFIVQQLRQIIPTPEIYVQGIKKSMKQLLSGLKWVRNPTENILDQVWTLLKEKDDILPDNTITILGSMIRTHCDVYPRNCRQDLSGLDYYPKVLEIARFFNNLLDMNGDPCKATPETVDKIIYVIRAIGNSRYVESSPNYLVSCALESNYKNISSVALQVLGEMKLDYDTRKELKNIYRDYTKDPEMRMMSYLAWMKEPTKDDIETAVKVLEGEMNTQVGSLVWSHLTSMNESVEPTSGESIGRMIKEVLRNKKIRSFNMTSKSTAWHKSTFNEKHNLGLSADSHVLYHPESLLPRYVHFNLSVDVLGGAFPVLEASTRTEGLELLWDRLFGPVGHFPDNHIKYIVKAKDSRIKRSINIEENELQYMHDRVNIPKPHPSGLFSIKLFDNELALFTLKDLEWLAHEVPMLDWVQELIDLKNGVDRIYTKNVLFLQDSFTIPTSIGLPLTLSLNGSAVGSVHVIAKGDLRSLFWSQLPDVELKASVKPSAAVSLSGVMSVDAFHSKVGILVNSTLFTSSNMSANVTYKKHDKLKFHYDVLEKPQEIFNISSMLFKQVNNKKTPIVGLKQRKKTSACISSIFNVTKYVGLDLCSKISVPVSWDKAEAPLLPLSGPANLSVNLHRSDPKLTTYTVEVNSTVSKTFNKTCLGLSTPGSTHKRIVLMNLTTLNKKDRLYQWNISVGDHETNWTVLNFTENRISKTIMAGMNITLTNFSLYHTTKVHKPNKIVTTNTSLLRGPHGRPVTLMFLNATFNYSSKITERSVTQDPALEEKMIFNLTHRPLKFTWQVKVKRNPSELKTNVSCIMKCKKRRSPLLNHRMVFNITEINVKDTAKTTEKGLHVEMFINETRRMSVFGNKKVFRTSGHKSSTYFTNFTYYNRTTLKPYTTSLNFTLNENLFTKWNKMRLNMTYKDNSITLETSMRNSTTYKRVCLNGTYINGTTWNKTGFKSCMAFLNDTLVKNLIWNVTALDKTHKLNATWFGGLLQKYLLVNYTCQKKSLANFTVSYRKTSSEKLLGMQSSIGNWSLDLHHSYQDEMTDRHRWRRVLITHKAKNRTEPFMYNAFDLSFWNSSTEKKVQVGMTLSTRTKKETLDIEPKSPTQFMNKTVSWQAEIRNNTQLLNASSLFEYQTMKEEDDEGLKLQMSKKKSNHTLFWDKTKNILNVSLDLPKATLGFNCSGTFNKGINVSANLNDSILWNVYISERQLISNVTLWNRTVMVERRTCDKCQALLLNISTWNVVNKTAFNGSFTWHLNGTSKKTSFNVTLINVNVTLLNTTFVNTSLYFTAFSLNDSHLNISFVRRNKSEIYNESSLEFRPGGRTYMEFNKTTLKRIWKELNLKSFDIPRKLLNITVSFTSRGANIKKTEKHLEILLRKITRGISTWNFTQKNLSDNLSKLRRHLLNVTSQALPNVPCDYNVYAKEKKFEILKFWSHLTKAIAAIPRAEIKSRKIAKELTQSLKNISDSFNKTRVIGNLSEVLGNVVVYSSSKRATHLKNLTDDLMFFLKNLTSNITDYLKTSSKDIGSWEIHAMRIDDHIKENITKVKDKVLYMLNESEIFIREIHEHLLILRDDVAFLSDFFISETYPELHIKTQDFHNQIKKLASPTAIAGGILHPWWLNVSETLKISIFNTTVHNFHKYVINKTAVEVIFPFLSRPDHITKVFHEKVLDKSLEKVMNSSMNKALEMYNVTLRLPSWHLNTTHDKVVYAKDLIVMLYNDTDNVMNLMAKKKLMVEIVEFYINQTQNVTGKTWNFTKHMMEGILNVSIPVDRRWEMMKANVTELYWNTSEKMPWARPLISWWNTTMHSLAKNNTPEKLMEVWMPKFVNFTLDKASDFTKYVNECLTDKQTQTPRIKMGYSNKTLIISTIHKMESKPNFTKFYSDSFWYYQNFTSSIFNKTKEPKNFTNSKTTMQWADDFFNRTSRIFDFAESVVNGSLANKAINNLTDKHVRSSPKVMELHNWVLNNTWGRMVNKSNVLYHSVKNTLNKVHETEAEDLAILFTPKNDTAFIINQRSHITFDKRSFRVPESIKSGCSFLIARDFLQGQFTVLATQNSYIIMTPDSKIEVYKDGRIKANKMTSNNVMTDLPVQFDDIYAIRDGPYIRVKSEDIGFEFELEMEHFIFAAYISGFYHNRTLGLLGTNNGEVSDDWLTPLAKNRTSLNLFLKSWLVSGDSDCLTERRQSQCKRKDSARCDELLKSKDSPFQKCFDVVDPKAFLEACMKEVLSCETSGPRRTSHCSVSAAYVRACVKNGVDISMPTQCADCYEQTRFMTSRREVDIVVIASEGTNMKEITQKIPDLVSRINRGLIDTNIRPRFGLVGFSGRPPIHWRGHTHTLNGKFFGSRKELKKGVETLDFAPWDLQTNISDGYMGIYHATKYPFNPGAKKIFILVTDSRRVPDSDLTSDMVSEAMKNIDAKLIVIGDYYFKYKMYGGDTDRYGYYKTSPRGTTHKNIERLPKEDEYVKVVSKTQGAVFMLKRFEKDDKILSEMVKNVILRYSKGKACMKCRCVPDEVGKGREVCRTTSNYWCRWN